MPDALTHIGVYGGSFDPVHFGHLRSAVEVKQQLSFDQLRFVPAGDPPHKEGPRVSAHHRVEMLKLGIANRSDIVIDQREIERDATSYSIDTLQSLKEDFPDTRLTLVIGTDQFNVFDQWHRWRELLTIADLAVMARPKRQQVQSGNEHVCEAESDTARELLEGEFKSAITLCQVTQLAISSTRIRRELQQGTDIQFLLPYAVRQYIIENQLYTGSGI